MCPHPGSAGPSMEASHQQCLLRVKGSRWPGQQMSLSATEHWQRSSAHSRAQGMMGKQEPWPGSQEPRILVSALPRASSVASPLWASVSSQMKAGRGVSSPMDPSGTNPHVADSGGLQERADVEVQSPREGLIRQAAAQGMSPGEPCSQRPWRPASWGWGAVAGS